MTWWYATDKTLGKGNRGQLWIQCDRWFDARAFASRKLGSNIEVSEDKEGPPVFAYTYKSVFRGTWGGNAASASNPSYFKVVRLKKKAALPSEDGTTTDSTQDPGYPAAGS